jgi:hypothetical protein
MFKEALPKQRRIASDKSLAALMKTGYTGIRAMAGVKQAGVMPGGRELKIAAVGGLKNAAGLIREPPQR